MGTTHIVESQIDLTLDMHRVDMTQRVISTELVITQFAISNHNVIIFKHRRCVYKTSINNRENRRIGRLLMKLRRITLQRSYQLIGSQCLQKDVI